MTDATRADGYRLLLELGRGGMGTVYLALVRGPGDFNKLKVVKLLLQSLAEEPGFLTMFMEEARLSARLNHPNIVQTNEAGFDGKNHFIEMEYLEGETLDVVTRRASRTGGLPLEIALYVVAQALAGLHYAHNLTDHDGNPLGIVHRDVSPQNVLVTHEGAVKLLDFGIAKTSESSVRTRTGDLRGKVKYMAPEQATRGSVVDRRADVFAMGIILWQLLTGRRLYEDLSEDEVLLKVRAPEIPAVRSIRPELPEELDAVVARALAPRAEDRFATAEELQVALEEHAAKGGRSVGPRQLAALMGTYFAERRAAVRSEIDAQIRAISASGAVPSIASIPLLAQSAGVRATASGASISTLVTREGYSPGALADPRALAESASPVSTGAQALPPRTGRLRAAVALAVAACVVVTAVVARRRPACSTNAECAAKAGAPALCTVEQRCVPFETQDCHVQAEPGNVDDDETLWFGVLLPQQGERATTFGHAFTNSIDVARRDFMGATGGIPSRKIGRPPRPVGLVVCDDADPQRAAKHLVDLHVPGVVGFGASGELVSLAPLFFAHDVLAVETVSSNALITSFPEPPGQPRLLWRTTGSAANEGKPLAATIEQLIEPRVRARPDVGSSRVALVRSRSAASLSVAEAFISELRVNDRSIALDPTAFRQYVYKEEDPSAEVAAIVDELLAFRPSIIVTLKTGFARLIATPLEARWPRDQPPPVYLFDGTMGDDDFLFISQDPRRRERYFGLDFPANTDTNLKFALRYNEFFTPKTTPGTAPGVGYDALFVLVYAAAAAGDVPITGSSLSRAIPRLLRPGVPIDVGGAAAFRAFGALAEGKNIDLNGAGTPLDFDLATGETGADYAVYCAHVDARGAIDDAMESGVRYSAASASLVGELHCP